MRSGALLPLQAIRWLWDSPLRCFRVLRGNRRYLRTCLIVSGIGVWPASARGAAPPFEVEDQAEHAQGPEGFVSPQLLEGVAIDYPAQLADALDGHAPAGTVRLEYVVGVDGIPFDVVVTQSVHPDLDALAIEATRELRYEAGTFQGQAVEVSLSIEIPFEPPRQAAPAAEPLADAKGASATGVQELEEPTLGPQRIRGQLRLAGERTPVVGARVTAFPADPSLPLGRVKKVIYGELEEAAWTLSARSDAKGEFELAGLDSGRVRLVVFKEGHLRLDYVEEVPANGVLRLEYFLRAQSDNPYRTLVEMEDEQEDTAKRSISLEEINAMPGTQGDALKALQNFPGVARMPFGAGGLVIRGSSPSDSQVFLGYHEIPNLFHFGALTSVFNSDILAQIDFIPGNFDSRFGDAIGGVVNVQPRRGRRDGFHGYVDSDVFDTGLLLEGPLGKGSFILSGRRSYIDLILPAVIPDDVNLDFEVAPRYYDYQALLDYPLGEGELSVRIFGSDDKLEFISQDENEAEADASDEFGVATLFHRADLLYRVKKEEWSFLITPSYRYNVFSGGGFDAFSFRFGIHTFSTRAEVSKQLSSRARLRVGTDMVGGRYTIEARAPSFPIPSQGDRGDKVAQNLDDPFFRPSLYTTATLAATDKLTFFPGMRLTYNALIFKRMAVDPRLRLRWQATDEVAVKAGVGTFSQVPDIFEFNPVWGNKNIGLERALHTSGGVEKKWAQVDLTVEATAFHKYVWDIAWPTSETVLDEGTAFRPERFWSTGTGNIYGVELLVRKELTRNFFGWVSYTLSKALEKPNEDTPTRPFAFDQPHILTTIAVYKLPYDWQVGARFRLVSGNPSTPLTDAIYDAKDNEFIAIEGDVNSERVQTFHQLDIRVDKRWVFKYVMFNLYLDVQNVYNARNVEGYNYAYNYQQRNPIAGLPIIPSLGMRLSF